MLENGHVGQVPFNIKLKLFFETLAQELNQGRESVENVLYRFSIPEIEEAAIELKDWGISVIKVDGAREKELTDQVLFKPMRPA